MTVFHAPLAMLPHGGLIRRPDLTAPEHQAALAGLSVLEDSDQRRTEARAYGSNAHAAQNTQLQITATQVLGTLGVAEDVSRTALGRHRANLAANDDAKTVISADHAVKRHWIDKWMASLSCVAVALLYIISEGLVLGQIVMTSGRLGLLPDNSHDQFIALTFAGCAIMIAFVKYAQLSYLKTSVEREAQLRKSWNRLMKIGIPAWIAAFVFLFGSSLIPGGIIAADPFAEHSAWAEALTSAAAESQMVLLALAWVFAVLLVFAIVFSASDFLVVIWSSHRETAARALREDIRMSETHVFRGVATDGLIADQIQTDCAIGRLKGLIGEIEADREAFADQVVHSIEALRLQGELARRTAILSATTNRNQVIDAGPLFSRR